MLADVKARVAMSIAIAVFASQPWNITHFSNGTMEQTVSVFQPNVSRVRFEDKVPTASVRTAKRSIQAILDAIGNEAMEIASCLWYKRPKFRGFCTFLAALKCMLMPYSFTVRTKRFSSHGNVLAEKVCQL